MPGPARAGLFIYAKSLARLAVFYEKVVGMQRLHETEEIAVLQSPDMQLVVHAVPSHIATTIAIASPPLRRENAALKFFFTVPNIAIARTSAAALGGEVFVEYWEGPGFRVCNAMDPEGNVFHLRETIA